MQIIADWFTIVAGAMDIVIGAIVLLELRKKRKKDPGDTGSKDRLPPGDDLNP